MPNRLSKIFALVLASSLLVHPLPAQTPDMQWTRPYAEALQQQQNLPVSTSNLEKTLTRLELATWVGQVFNLPAPKKTVTITDIPKSSADYAKARAFVQAGLGSAPGGKFQPKGDYTRLEAIALFDRLLKLTAPGSETTTAWLSLYKDGDQVAAEGKPFVAAAAQAGLIINYPNPKELGPDFILTRGEGAVLLYQALVSRQKLNPLPPPVAQLTIEAPKLTAIEVQPKDRALKPGESVTITAQGTPGTKATYSLGDLVRNQPLKETQPGIYTAFYKVKAGDYLNNPAISVALSRGGLEDRKQRIAVLSVGTAPVGRSTVAAAPPASNDDAASNNDSNNNTGIDPYSGTSPNGIPGGFGGGNNNANRTSGQAYSPGLYRPDFRNNSGGSGRSTSDLASASIPPQITQVGFNSKPGKPFVPGDVLVVTLRGDQGGAASFRIDGYTAEVKMKEQPKGFYKAEVKIGKNLDIPNGKILLTLNKFGKTAIESIPEPITVFPAKAVPKAQF